MAECKEFFKFPRTVHLANLGSVTRDDLLCDEANASQILSGTTLTVEEKVDGANLGISFLTPGQLALQKRGHYISYASEPQYRKLESWIARREADLQRVLGTRYILFGEWLAARHSVAYDALPDLFLAFDVFDKSEERFLSRQLRDAMCRDMGVRVVRILHHGPLQGGLEQLRALVMASMTAYATAPTPVEGAYVRVDDPGTQRLVSRGKLVRAEFMQAIEEHWGKRAMVPNGVRPDLWPELQEEVDGAVEQHVVVPAVTLPIVAAADAVPTRHAGGSDGVIEAQEGAEDMSEDGDTSSVDHRATTGSTSSPVLCTALGTRPAIQCALVMSHGVVCVVGAEVDAIAGCLLPRVPAAAAAARAASVGPHFHLTLFDPEETKQLTTGTGPSSGSDGSDSEQLIQAWTGQLDLGAWVSLGVGKVSGGPAEKHNAAAYYAVVAWPSGHELRGQLGLTRRAFFHITLGWEQADVHSRPKSLSTLLDRSDPAVDRSHAATLLAPRLLGAAGDSQQQPAWIEVAAVLLQQALVEVGDAAHVARDPTAAWSHYHTCVTAAHEACEQAAGPTTSTGAAVGKFGDHLAFVRAAAHALCARALGRDGDMAACIEHARAAQAADPSLALPCLLLGKALYQGGQFVEAAAAFSGAAAAWEVQAARVGGNAAAGGGDALAALDEALFQATDVGAASQGVHMCRKAIAAAAAAAAAAMASTSSPATAAEETQTQQQDADENDGQVDDYPTGVSYGLEGETQGPLDPRSRFTVAGVCVDGQEQDVGLMRNTSWLIPGQLMVSSTPKYRRQICALSTLGITLVVTLTEEEPLPAAWFTRTGVTNLFVPVPNYEPPNPDQMDGIAQRVELEVAAGGAVLVHCGGGKGRAGTVAACLMCKHGLGQISAGGKAGAAGGARHPQPVMAADQSVRTLRGLRPGSIETEQQQRFVNVYNRLLWQRFAQHEAEAPAPVPAPVPARARPARAAAAAIQPKAGSKTALATTEARTEHAAPSANRTHTSGAVAGVPAEAVPSAAPSVTDDDASTSVTVGDVSHLLPGAYPSTPHLPFSPQVADDDTQLTDAGAGGLLRQQLVLTEKLDGANCTVHAGLVYARTHRQPATHASFSMVKALAADWYSRTAADSVPPHLAFVGENLAAVHSLTYDGLAAPFYLFAVWDGARRVWLGWEQVVGWAARLGVPTVPLLWRGQVQSLSELGALLARLAKQPSSVGPSTEREGFVARIAAEIPEAEFGRAIAKYVRKGHVQTDATWRRTWRPARIPGPEADACTAAIIAAAAAAAAAAHNDNIAPIADGSAALSGGSASKGNGQGGAPASTSGRGSPSRSPTAPDDQTTTTTATTHNQSTTSQNAGPTTTSVTTSSSAVKLQTPQQGTPPGGTAGMNSLSNVAAAVAGAGAQRPRGGSSVSGSSSAAGAPAAAARATSPPAAAPGPNKAPPAAAKASSTVPAPSRARAPAPASGNLPRIVFLVGLPGSGKSVFSDALVRSGHGWVRVSQDECGGSRRACEEEWSHITLRGGGGGGQRLLLDRCNATAADRKDWMGLALLGKRDKGVWAVHFATGTAEDCAARVAARTDHPTIPQGRGKRIVESFAKQLQPPVQAEGFERVITVRSFEEVDVLLRAWGAAPPQGLGPDPATAPKPVPEWMKGWAAYEEGSTGDEQQVGEDI